MKNPFLLAAAALIGVASLAGAARAATPIEFHGSLCVPATPADASKLTYTQFGVHNTASTAANVVCPITINGVTSAQFSITAYDRSTISDVVCSVFGTGSDGNITLSASLSTNSSAGPPFTRTTGFFSLAASKTAHLQCAIPAFQSGSGFSHLTSYRLMPP